MENIFWNIYVGAETGLLKGVNVEKQKWQNINSIETASREYEVVTMCWADKQQKQLCMGLRDRTVQVYNTENRELKETHHFAGGDGKFSGLCKHDNNFVTCTESGLLKVWGQEGAVVEVNAGPNVQRMRQNGDQSHLVATGGKGNDLKIWDLNSTTQPIFKAKNVKHNWLNLEVPVCVLDMAFIPESEKIITCTEHHQVRLYDPKTSQRRPVLDMEFDEYPLSAMSLRPGGYQVVVGNTHGKMALLDLRGTKGYMVNCYRGFAGGIQCIECHPTMPLVASCGLDRFLRVHDIDTKMMHSKFYLKSRLNCLLFAEQWTNEEADNGPEDVVMSSDVAVKAEEDTEGGEDEAVWSKMTVIGVENTEKTARRTKRERTGKRAGEKKGLGGTERKAGKGKRVLDHSCDNVSDSPVAMNSKKQRRKTKPKK